MDLSRWRDSGDLFLPKGLRAFLETYYIGSKTSVFYITNWSLVHFVSGILLAALYSQWGYSVWKTVWMTLLVHTVWEIWQILITNTPRTLRGFVDVWVDTGMFMAGVGIVLFHGKQK